MVKFESQDVYFSTKKLIYVQTFGSRMLYISWRWPQLDPHISHAWCWNRDPLNPTTSFHKRSILSKKSLFFYLYVCFYKCQNGINFVQEKPLYFGFICVSANVNVIVNKQLFLIWSGRHSVWNVRQVLKLERFLCNWTISIIDGGDISFIHLQALNNRLMVSIYHPLLLFVAHPKLLNQSYYSFEKVATLKLSLILFGVSNSSCKREKNMYWCFS